MKKILFFCLLLTSLAWGQDQHTLNRQAEERFQKADAELNQVYKKLTARLDKGSKAQLVDAQLIWIKLRDADAKARAAGNEGGSIYPMIYAGSRAASTEARVRYLKEWLNEYR